MKIINLGLNLLLAGLNQRLNQQVMERKVAIIKKIHINSLFNLNLEIWIDFYLKYKKFFCLMKINIL